MELPRASLLVTCRLLESAASGMKAGHRGSSHPLLIAARRRTQPDAIGMRASFTAMTDRAVTTVTEMTIEIGTIATVIGFVVSVTGAVMIVMMMIGGEVEPCLVGRRIPRTPVNPIHSVRPSQTVTVGPRPAAITLAGRLGIATVW